MAGVTKHIYEHDLRDIRSMWTKELKEIKNILPKYYNDSDIIELLKKFYPHEWNSVEFKYSYYTIKDKKLLNRRKKLRYQMLPPEKLLRTLPLLKKLLNENYRKKYSEDFEQEEVIEKSKDLLKNRAPKIKKIDEKIEKAILRTQKMTPNFLDKLIGLYERKRTSQKDKKYILQELKKYYNKKIINFFLKLNDTEINSQLRWEAFYHLQSFNINPRARKQKYILVHTKNRKRKKYLKDVYSKETYNIPFTPNELEYRIKNGKEQQLKEFDFFISHSYKDGKTVQKLITYQNELDKNIFCDWINDADYLKRKLLGKETLEVIRLRLEQSKNLIFVESEDSKNSIWCKYELNYYLSLDKPIYYITKEDIERDNFIIKPLENKWFIDNEYKNKIKF